MEQLNPCGLFSLLKEGCAMQHKPLKPYGYPDCPNLTEGQYCEEHKGFAA